MIDTKALEDILNKISDALPNGAKTLEQDAKNKVRQVLQDSFARLDLVSREEFDVQTKVLARTRAKVEQLEQQIAALEAKK